MKIKIALVTYFDWVILAVLGIGLIYALFQAFVVEDRTVRDLRGEIDLSIRKIETGMRKLEADPPKTGDHLAALKRRFVQPPVLSAYTKNPFLPGPFVQFPPVQLWKGQEKPKEIVFKNIRIANVLPYPEVNLTIKLAYDLEVGDSVVTIAPRAASDSYVQFRDDQGIRYGMRVKVREKQKMPEPFDPLSPFVAGYSATEDAAGKRQAAKALIACAPYNSPHRGVDYGITTHVVIERKIEGRPDADFVVVTSAFAEGRMPVLTAAQAVALRAEFKIDKTEADADGENKRLPERSPTPGRRMGGEAMEAEDYDRRNLRESRSLRDNQQGTDAGETGGQVLSLDELLRQGNFAFVDKTVDEGESYVYRIWTVAVSEDVSATRSQTAYQFPAIYIRPMVEFTFSSVSSFGCTARVIRQRPGESDTVEETFRLTHGQLIGGKIERKEYESSSEGRGRRYRVVEIDFSTNAVLVGGVSGVKRIEYTLRDDWRNDKIIYRVRQLSNPQAIYLTPRNSLRWQERETSQSTTDEGRTMPDVRTPRRGRGGLEEDLP